MTVPLVPILFEKHSRVARARVRVTLASKMGCLGQRWLQWEECFCCGNEQLCCSRISGYSMRFQSWIRTVGHAGAVVYVIH